MREAWRRRGHDAYSCDILPAEDSSPYHLQMDMCEAVQRGPWDFIGGHLACTYLCGSGIHWNDRGRGWEKTEAALADVRWFMALPEPGYLENSIGIISSRIRKPDQIIQPYQFGEDASKKTALWLKGVPTLTLGKRFPGRLVQYKGKTVERWSNQTDSGQNRLGPSPDRWKERSRAHGLPHLLPETDRTTNRRHDQ